MNARDEGIVLLIHDIEEGRTHMISKEGLSAALSHEMLKKTRSEMTEEISQLAGELEDLRKKNDETEVEKRTLLGRLEGHAAEMERNLAEWCPRHDTLESEKAEHQEAQRALEEQAEHSNAELDRMQAQL
ncbi:hypothetical protein JOM56_007776 [Amanita muscaria]